MGQKGQETTFKDGEGDNIEREGVLRAYKEDPMKDRA